MAFKSNILRSTLSKVWRYAVITAKALRSYFVSKSLSSLFNSKPLTSSLKPVEDKSVTVFEADVFEEGVFF